MNGWREQIDTGTDVKGKTEIRHKNTTEHMKRGREWSRQHIIQHRVIIQKQEQNENMNGGVKDVINTKTQEGMIEAKRGQEGECRRRRRRK